MKREKLLWRDVLVLLAFLLVYGLVGGEDLRVAQEADAVRAWSVAQWESDQWGGGR